MTTKFFKNVKCIEDVKKQYKELAKKFHPDCGGDAEQFKAMSNEYTILFEQYKDIHMSAKGETYEKEEKTTETPDIYKDIIDKVIHFRNVTIEIIGTWIWLSGNTLIYKDEIKKAGFFWSKTKQSWYYNGETTKTTRRGKYSMRQLREMWGSTKVESELYAELA